MLKIIAIKMYAKLLQIITNTITKMIILIVKIIIIHNKNDVIIKTIK